MAFKRRGRPTDSDSNLFDEDSVDSPSSRLEPKPTPSPEKLEQRARNVLLYQLSKSAKSREQLRVILEQREIPDEIAHAVLERFTEVGLIDDVAFAQTVVSSRLNFKGLAKSSIRRELSTKGVDAHVIEEVTQDITPESELKTAQDLAVRRYRTMAHLAKEVRDRRLSGYLARKGYSANILFSAIRYAEANYQATHPDP